MPLAPVVTSMPLATAGTKTDPAGRTYTVLSDSLYLLGKYGKGQGTSQFSHVWYIGGILPGKQVTLPSLGDDDMLSHDTLFSGTRVPDGGTSTLLLGVAFMLLGASRRFFRA